MGVALGRRAVGHQGAAVGEKPPGVLQDVDPAAWGDRPEAAGHFQAMGFDPALLYDAEVDALLAPGEAAGEPQGT
jgi:hypothetical protein